MKKNSLLSREIDKLNERVLFLGGKVESSFRRAIKSIEENNLEIAEEVIEGDKEIDALEVELEEECLKILALHQPVAVDLRLVIAVLKVNNDLERIGDLTANLAEHARMRSEQPEAAMTFDFPRMSSIAMTMLTTSLDSLVKGSASLAWEVRKSDDEVDEIHRQMYQKTKQEIQACPECAETLINFIGISRIIERIADLSTNIAEDVIYLVDGEIVRH